MYKEQSNQHRRTAGSESKITAVRTPSEHDLGYTSRSADFCQTISFQKQESVVNVKRLQQQSDPIEEFKHFPPKLITIINRKLPKSGSRVMLNAQSFQSIESLIKELGESVQLSEAKVLFAANGQLVSEKVQRTTFCRLVSKPI